MERIRDTGETGDLRVALLDLLGDQPSLLPWLRHFAGERVFGLDEAVLSARGRQGDRTATHDLVLRAASPWPDVRRAGQAGLDGLVEHHGVDTILADLDDSPADRICRVRLRHRRGETVIAALADPEVAYVAQSLITDPDELRAYLVDAPTAEARLWVAYALYNLTEDLAETQATYEALGRPRVEVDGLPEDQRRAIVHEYVPTCERDSDPRWRLEALCTKEPDDVDVAAQLARATQALNAPPIHCAVANQQGDGTYYEYEVGDNRVHISTLGPYAKDTDGTARQALEAAGFQWIDDTTGAIVVTGLCVYFFGRRDPLTVDDLLFFWQD